MANFPPDRFDQVPAELKRVGAHRVPAKRGRGWIAFAWAALATGVLVIAGLYGLSRVNPDIAFELPTFGGGSQPDASPSPTTSTVPPVTDPTTVDPALGLTLSILNASSVDGLQNTAGDAILAAGWPDPSRNTATAHDITETVVYYSSAEFEGIARGLAQLLGFDKVQLTDNYPGAPVTIVLGQDYATLTGNGG
jgi:hypothetical protein